MGGIIAKSDLYQNFMFPPTVLQSVRFPAREGFLAHRRLYAKYILIPVKYSKLIKSKKGGMENIFIKCH